MLQSNSVQGTPLLDFEGWRASLRAICGRYSSQGIERNAFQGWARSAARPAAGSSIRFAWIAPRTICTAARCCERADRSARSPPVQTKVRR
jgi:hypothetical protein